MLLTTEKACLGAKDMLSGKLDVLELSLCGQPWHAVLYKSWGLDF